MDYVQFFGTYKQGAKQINAPFFAKFRKDKKH